MPPPPSAALGQRQQVKPDEDTRAQAGTVTIAPRRHRGARAAWQTFFFINQMID
jgi:hypothetical protein